MDKKCLPERKRNRLKEYDYSSTGAYFITVCTAGRRNLFWKDVGASIARPQDICLSHIGVAVADAVQRIAVHYPTVAVDEYTIMPNHLHLLLRICDDADGRPMVAPTMSTLVQQLKGYVSKCVGRPIWQKSFHDHIVRGEKDYLEIRRYIEGNPMKWAEDSLFSEE